MARDIVFIKNLKTLAIIGIYPHERVNKQPIIISLEMEWGNQKPSTTEDINDALDYEKISNSVKALIEGSEFQLVETLAETIAKHIITTYQTPWLKLILEKPEAITFTDAVGIQIERSKKDYE